MKLYSVTSFNSNVFLITLRRLVILFFIFCYFQHAVAQKVSSYQSKGLKDTVAVNKLMATTQKLYGSMPDSAIMVFYDILNSSLNLRYEQGIVEATVSITHHYNRKGDYEKSYRLLQRVQDVCQRLGLKGTMLYIFSAKAFLYERWGNADSAAYYFDKAITLTEFSQDKHISAAPYNNYGAWLAKTGQYSRAIEYLNKGAQIALETNQPILLTQALLNKGIAWRRMEEWSKSEEDLLRGLAIAKKHGYAEWQFNALTSLGNCYADQKKYDKAIAVLKEALSIKKVEPFYKNRSMTIIGQVYYEKRDFSNALYYLKAALITAEKLDLYEDIINCNKTLSLLYQERGLYKDAMKHQLAYTRLKDSLDNVQVKQNISQLDVKFRTAQKDKEIVSKQLKISRQAGQLKEKNIWIIGISASALLLAAVLTVLYILYRNNQHRQNLQEQKIHTLEQQQQIDQLKAMMSGEEKERTRIARELHDGIGGMLAAICMNVSNIKDANHETTTGNKLGNVLAMLKDTTSEVRKTAHNLMPDVLMRHRLKDALLIYCTNINTNNKLQVDLQCHGDLEQLNKAIELIIYRTIQELLQNVIKHAHASNADVQLMVNEDKLNISVEDDGVGFDIDRTTGGYGLQNLQFRIQALQGYIAVTSEKGKGTTVFIEFELEHLKNHVA